MSSLAVFGIGTDLAQLNAPQGKSLGHQAFLTSKGREPLVKSHRALSENLEISGSLSRLHMLSIQQANQQDWPHIQSGLVRTPLNEGSLISTTDASYLVARKGGKFAGFCMVVMCDDMGLLPALFVESAYRSKGIAAHLVATSVATASSMGARWVFTGCQPYGIPFLQRLGFEVEKRELIPTKVLDRIEAAGGGDLVLLSIQVTSLRANGELHNARALENA